jgi:hypothetical protein
VNPDLVRAIHDKRLIEFTYKSGGARVAEPHDYGVRGGVERLLAFQLSGESRNRSKRGWRDFLLADIHNLYVQEQRFPGSRGDRTQDHLEWDVLFARVT